MYTQSDEQCNFTKESPCVKKAKEIADSAMNDADVVRRCFEAVKHRGKYDYVRSFTQKAAYKADIDGTWNSGKGICLDFAGVLAAMCRSVGIPAKIMIGWADKKYHAWNSIQIDGVWTRYDVTAAITGKKVMRYMATKNY